MTMKFVESNAIETSTPPIDTTGAAQTGDRYNMENYGKITFIIAQGAWAGGTSAVTFQEHTAATAGSSQALAVTKRWTKVGVTGTVFVETAVAANTFDLPNVANTINVVEFNVEDLDTDDGFTFVSCNTASPGANADLVCVIAILSDPRYSGDPATQLVNPKV